jgi:hypothetical protein
MLLREKAYICLGFCAMLVFVFSGMSDGACADGDIVRVSGLPKLLVEETDKSFRRIIAGFTRFSDDEAFSNLKVDANGEVVDDTGFEWGGGWECYVSGDSVGDEIIQRASGDIHSIFDEVSGWLFTLYYDGRPVGMFTMEETVDNPFFAYMCQQRSTLNTAVIEAVEALGNYSARSNYDDIIFVGRPMSLYCVAVDVSDKVQTCVVVGLESEYHNMPEYPRSGEVFPVSEFIGWYQQRESKHPLIDDSGSLNYLAMFEFIPTATENPIVHTEAKPVMTYVMFGVSLVIIIVVSIVVYKRK